MEELRVTAPNNLSLVKWIRYSSNVQALECRTTHVYSSAESRSLLPKVYFDNPRHALNRTPSILAFPSHALSIATSYFVPLMSLRY